MIITHKTLSNVNRFKNRFTLSINIFKFKKFLSGTTKNTKNNYDEPNLYKIDNNLRNLTLNAMTVPELKNLCKEKNIYKYSKLKKNQLIDRLNAYFLAEKTKILETKELKTTYSKFPILFNDKNQINISIWYRIAQKRITRWIESSIFKNIVDVHCKDSKKTKNDVITQSENGDIYVDLMLAFITAARFNPDLHYDVFKFYANRYDHQSALIETLKQKLLLNQQGIPDITLQKWETFKFPFAYYILEINNIINCGVVRGSTHSKKTLLDARLAVHRNTYAKFKLINVFQFNDSNFVSGFEIVMKGVLEPYSIGRNGLLEQYEIKNQNTAEIINKIVTTEFDSLKKANNQIGSTCPEEKIHNYNESICNRIK